MQVTIVFESMYGNTHTIADRIAEGFGGGVDVIVTPVDRVDPTTVGVGLLIVGGPTHVHGLTSSRTRAAAVAAAEADEGLHLDGASIEPGSGTGSRPSRTESTASPSHSTPEPMPARS